ncbi:MAG: aspartate kinase [Sphaerochaetaceae bacterium]|jgi:aspartate kinase|nr:aspartate kinase [Sphaerochaetaceae bacterium]MDD3163809.1 aspartate kinase [Sphaerochaetaceae bacterium]MDD4008051.1 aspartate kinase [Sphaerochaetaceae bacterium]MDD4397076.1 aspartate kinase [Sphaerochaetaceae bacterium]
MLKVAKFGGSSLADSQQFAQVRRIVQSDPDRMCVVVSAAGKRSKGDSKITDLLYLTQAHRKYGVSYDDIFSLIEQRCYDIRTELGLSFDLESEFSRLRAELKGDIDVDYLVSRGEFITAHLMSEYLGYSFVDAADCIFFNYDGKINYEKTYQAIADAALKTPRFVLPGFYGALPNGRIHTMPRGGSDITGSIAANALDADIYENWTDVSGILMADPKVVSNPKPIPFITYDELRELSYMGASVLQEESILPVKEKNIPLNIRNTNRPEDKGTMILESIDDDSGNQHLLTGIAGRKNFTVLTIYQKHISTDTRIIRKTLEMLQACNVEVQHITLGVDSFNVVVPTSEAGDKIYDIISEIKTELNPDGIKMDDNIALIASVGRRMVSVPGSSARLFGALGANKINIRMIAQGSEEISIIVGVDNKDFERTIRTLYDGFMDGEADYEKA